MNSSGYRRQIFFLAMAAALFFVPGKGQAADGDAPAITLGVGKSRLVELPSGYSDVMIGDPKIADVQPLNQRSVYVVGKGMGSTSLTVYGTGRRVIYSSDVVVSADLDGLRARLHEVLPNETNVKVTTANQSHGPCRGRVRPAAGRPSSSRARSCSAARCGRRTRGPRR